MPSEKDWEGGGNGLKEIFGRKSTKNQNESRTFIHHWPGGLKENDIHRMVERLLRDLFNGKSGLLF